LAASPQQRGAGKDAQVGQEDVPAADHVAEPPGQQQQAGERDQVGIHDPGQARLREAQPGLDGR
jgi:hypothetical protein